METKQNFNDEEMTIDLGELLRELLSNAVVIILAALVGALLAMFITKTNITPTYSSTAKLYVMARSDSDTITSTDVSVGSSLTTDYEEIIQSRYVAETVIARLGLTYEDGTMYDYESLLGQLTVTTPDDSRVIDISVSDDDPYEAADIADAILEASMEQIQSVMEIETISVVESANIPTSADSPSTMRNTMYGGLIGALIAIIIVVALYLTNDTIRTTEDIEKYLGLSTIGTIPLDSHSEKTKKKFKLSPMGGGTKK